MRIIDKSLPLHIQVYDHIKEEIITGVLPSGEKIQEVKLSHKLEISRSPVREAIRMLENDRLIIKNNSGLIVNPMLYDDAIEVYECRIILESFAAGLAAKNIKEYNLKELERCIDKMVILHESNNKKNYLSLVQTNSEFHQVISKSSEHKLLNFYIEKNHALSMLSRAKEFYLFSRGPEYINEHINIYKAIKARDSVSAEKFTREHIKNDLNFYKTNYKGFYSKKS